MSCDTKGFEELMRNLENEQNRIDDFCKDCSIRIVSEVFKKAAKRSPVDTGTLRRGFTITDNLEMSKIGDTFKTSVTNNTSLLMADLLINGVCNALYNEFGDDYEYYIDEIKQGLDKSCFFVSYVRNAQNRYINNRLRSENRISIQFIPTDDVSAEKRSEIANRLYTCLDCIDYGPDKLFGKEMQCEPLSDNMLNFQVSYNFFKKVVSDNIDEMNELRLNQIRGD